MSCLCVCTPYMLCGRTANLLAACAPQRRQCGHSANPPAWTIHLHSIREPQHQNLVPRWIIRLTTTIIGLERLQYQMAAATAATTTANKTIISPTEMTSE